MCVKLNSDLFFMKLMVLNVHSSSTRLSTWTLTIIM